eukprot:TRINITY_DN12279_c0_g1_i1.p1 TRINITY_DN12279_c0_g1~~TRINITY_DN12279_c0_g1_i1.p1  ORF type:complete len:415 (+),score=82.12 TRINITY_DN12279_c0_g1_i1:770-2014(+)
MAWLHFVTSKLAFFLLVGTSTASRYHHASFSHALRSLQTTLHQSSELALGNAPILPDQFESSMNLSLGGRSSGVGRMLYSKPLKAMYTEDINPAPLVNGTEEFEQLFLENNLYVTLNSICRPVDGAFYDFFGWVQYASSAGTAVVNNRPCQLWQFNTSHDALSVCVDADLRPVQYTLTLDHFPYSQTFDFGPDFHSVTSINASVFVPAEDCLHPAPTCQDRSINTTTSLLAYVFHPNTTTGDIANQDVADELGDVVFICGDVLTNNTGNDHYSWVTLYNLTVVDNWAQYQQCNDYPGTCLGYGGPGVGREASYGVHPNAGQCTPNDDVGNWYSLPKQGMCQRGQTMGLDYNCTWYIQRRIKTIDARCLLDTQGMQASCVKEGQVPFVSTRAILRKAFASEDVVNGGCPELVPHV